MKIQCVFAHTRNYLIIFVNCVYTNIFGACVVFARVIEIRDRTLSRGVSHGTLPRVLQYDINKYILDMYSIQMFTNKYIIFVYGWCQTPCGLRLFGKYSNIYKHYAGKCNILLLVTYVVFSFWYVLTYIQISLKANYLITKFKKLKKNRKIMFIFN